MYERLLKEIEETIEDIERYKNTKQYEEITTRQLYYAMGRLNGLEKAKSLYDMYGTEEEKVISKVKTYCEIAFRDSEENPNEPISKKDLEYIYEMIIKYKEVVK